MAEETDSRDGIRALIKTLKKMFRIPENLAHYTQEDFQKAEKKFLKFCLQNGCIIDDRGTVGEDGSKKRHEQPFHGPDTAPGRQRR